MAETWARKTVRVALFVLVGIAIAGGAWASDLTVEAGAARDGNFGLAVSVGNTCTSDADTVVPDQSVSSVTTFEGCLTLTATNVDILSSGDVTFSAGDKITLENGFSVASGANFTAALDQGMTGRAYVQDSTPSAEQLYRARFYIDLSSLSPGGGVTFDHFSAYSSSGTPEFELQLEDSGANVALVVNARHGGAVSSITADSALPISYFAVEFEWKASVTGLTNGHLDVWVDGSQVAGLSNLDNEYGRIDYVRWGVVDAVDSSTTGTMKLDDFVSRRSSTTIGTLP
jgi:hypothetical protein